MLLPCGLLVGCETTSDNGAPLELIEDYLIWSGIQSDMEPEEVDYEYYGTYGDSVVVFFQSAGAYETPTDERVAGYRFKYPDSRVIRVWNDGKFYKLSEAYEKKLLKGSDIFSIYLKHLFVEVEEPLFIYEEKGNFRFDPDADFAGETIIVELDKNISDPDKEIDIRFFDNEIKCYISACYYDKWFERLCLYLTLLEPSRENAIKLKTSIERIDGVHHVTLDYYFDLDSYLPDDEYYFGEYYGLTSNM